MPEAKKILMRIVAEAALESHLLRDLDRLEVKGYTISDVRGKGRHGMRGGGWDVSSNIRVEIICDEAVADAVKKHLSQTYCSNYAVITYWSEVSVMRGEKF